MSGTFDRLAIVGGGTAGWLTACILAAKRPDLTITLIEAPDIPTIGVGEGTWPTMRETLRTIGIPETEFLRECDASFKQGSRFDGWVDGSGKDSYLHPFTPPPADISVLLGAIDQSDLDFAEAVSPQADTCARDLAPRQRNMPDYAGALNYGYHLDAGKFADLLKRHAVTRLGVTHLSDRVEGVEGQTKGMIDALILRCAGRVEADFYVDCSGLAAVLIGGHCGSEWIDRSDVSLNDSALAVQIPVAPASPIASQTIGTAHEAGWLWDIGLPTRRGIGCVYSSQFIDHERAEEVLRSYISCKIPAADWAGLLPRKLEFPTGYRERIWAQNCLAIGMSAGFIEPLEASALVMVELSCRMLAENFPTRREALDLHAARFNERFRYRWDRIVDFLKLHYALSRRTEPYWMAQRNPAAIPSRLCDQLELWREAPPSAWDFPQQDEVFSAASQQYVLYGMRFPPPNMHAELSAEASRTLSGIKEKARTLVSALPSNRSYLTAEIADSAKQTKTGELAQS